MHIPDSLKQAKLLSLLCNPLDVSIEATRGLILRVKSSSSCDLNCKVLHSFPILTEDHCRLPILMLTKDHAHWPDHLSEPDLLIIVIICLHKEIYWDWTSLWRETVHMFCSNPFCNSLVIRNRRAKSKDPTFILLYLRYCDLI
jgi:hypothetical protein